MKIPSVMFSAGQTVFKPQAEMTWPVTSSTILPFLFQSWSSVGIFDPHLTQPQSASPQPPAQEVSISSKLNSMGAPHFSEALI